MKRKITFLLIFSILLSTIAPATKSYASENQSNKLEEVTNNQSNVHVTDDGIFIDDKFYTQEEFTNLLDSAILVSEDNTNGISTRNAAVADAGAMLVAGTWWIPGVGEVVVTAAGVIIVAGTVVAVGSWAYKTVTNWFKNRAYNKSAEKAVNNCNSNKRNHIMQRKHNWNNFNKKPNWSNTAPLLIKALQQGNEKWEKGDQYIRSLYYKGHTIVVRFIKDSNGLVKYISTAWSK